MSSAATDTREHFYVWHWISKSGIEAAFVLPVLLAAAMLPGASGEPVYLLFTAGWYALHLRLRRTLSFKAWIVVQLPATFLHELAHWLGAVLQGGNATMSLIPEQKPDGRWNAGACHFSNVHSITLVSMAPVLLWPFAVALMQGVVLHMPLSWTSLGLWFLCIQMIHAALMISVEDLSNVPLLARLLCYALALQFFTLHLQVLYHALVHQADMFGAVFLGP